MSSNARTAIGLIFNRWNTDGTTGVWQEILECTNVDWGGLQVNVAETFPLNTVDRYVNKKKGSINSGQITVDVNYLFDQFYQLKQDAEASANGMYQVVLPNGEALEFDGFPVTLPLSLSADAVMQSSIVFEIDGKLDFVSTAS